MPTDGRSGANHPWMEKLTGVGMNHKIEFFGKVFPLKCCLLLLFCSLCVKPYAGDS